MHLWQILSFCVLWSVCQPPLLPSNYHFFSFIKPSGDSCQARSLPQSRAGSAILQGTFLWAHLLSEGTKRHTHTPALHPLVFFCWVLHYSVWSGKSAFSTAPQHLQLFWNSRDKAHSLPPQLKALHPPLVKDTKATSEVLHPVLGSWVQEKQGGIGEAEQRATKVIRGLEHLS